MKVVINPDVCQGHLRCALLMPEFFEPDEMGHGTTADSQVPAHLESEVRHVADNCPERAISIVEE